MFGSMVVLIVVGALGLQAIYAFEPRLASPALAFLRTSAEPHDEQVSAFGGSLAVEDPLGDHGVGAAGAGGAVVAGGAADILAADIAGIYYIPEWLYEDVFKCGAIGVACGHAALTGTAEDDIGGFVFVQRMATPRPSIPDGAHREWGPMVRVTDLAPAPEYAGAQFEGANYRFITELDGTSLRMRGYSFEGTWNEFQTAARSAWRDDLLVTIVPFDDLSGDPSAWNAYASAREGAANADDNVRAADGKVIEIGDLPWIEIFDPNFVWPDFSFDPEFSFPPDFPFDP